MKDLLQRYGYKYDGTCNCDGHHTEKYSKDDYQLRIRTKRNQFKLKRGNHTLTAWAMIATLENTLNNVHNAAVPA